MTEHKRLLRTVQRLADEASRIGVLDVLSSARLGSALRRKPPAATLRQLASSLKKSLADGAPFRIRSAP